MLNEKLEIPSVRELAKVTMNRSEWTSKTPFKKWCFLYGIGSAVNKTIGITLFTEDQTLSWLAFLPFATITIYTVLAIYTVFYFSSHGEPFKCLPCTCILIGPLYSVRIKPE